MSATSNVLWAGLGVAAGYVLALYVEQLEQDDEPSVDGDDDDEGPDLREVDDEADPEIDVPVMKVQEWDGEQWMN